VQTSKFDGIDRRKWHINKELSIGDIISFAGAVGVIFLAWLTLHDEQLVMKGQLAELGQHDISIREEFREWKTEVLLRMTRQEDKLDRVLLYSEQNLKRTHE
jgi:hypothetical protein